MINLVKKDVKFADKNIDQIMVRYINQIKIQQWEIIVKANSKRSSKKQKIEQCPYYDIRGTWEDSLRMHQKLGKHNWQKINLLVNVQNYVLNK